jgi:hypothetical protein
MLHGITTRLLSTLMYVSIRSLSLSYVGSHQSKQAGYVVIPFIDGYKDIAGKFLKLDHIADPNFRPLDELLRDHFLQGVLKNMKGAGDPTWDYEDALGRMDLPIDLWGSKEGQAHFEFEMAHRLHSL